MPTYLTNSPEFWWLLSALAALALLACIAWRVKINQSSKKFIRVAVWVIVAISGLAFLCCFGMVSGFYD